MWGSHRARPTVGEDRRIELLRRLGEDPIGALWDAEDGHFHRKVTVRVFRDELGAHRRFMQMLRGGLTRVWPRLKHPNVASAITYVDGPDSSLHIVMERLEGETLAERLDRAGRIDPGEARRIGSEVRAALDAAHAIGLVHGGLTPHGVFLTRTGEVKVLDFGIPAALWSTAREAGEAVGDDGVALVLDPSRDARDLERLEQRMLSGPPVSDEFDLRRLIELVLASPSEPSAAGQPAQRTSTRGRVRGHRSERVGRTRRIRASVAGAWVGRVRDSAIDTTHAAWSVPRGAGRWVRRSCRRTWSSMAGGLRAVASGVGRLSRAVMRRLRATGLAVARGIRAVARGAVRAMRSLVAGTGRALHAFARPIRPAGRHVAAASRALAAAPRRAAPATGRLLSRAKYPLVGAGVLVLVVVGAVVAYQGVPTPVEREQPASASTAPSPLPPAGGVTVPDVNGLSPMEAGALLSSIGLSVVDAEPAPGPPGTVVGTVPAIDEVVDPATPIVLLVGASPDRMDEEN
jgi:hypothetical protein